MLGAKHTLLVLASHWLARIDLAGRGRRMRTEQVSVTTAPAEGSLAARALLAWQTRATTGAKRHVWVLSFDLWNETLTLPWETALMLGSEEIEHALALEAEAYGGSSSFASRVHYRKIVDRKIVDQKIVDASSNCIAPSPGQSDPQWWVTQIATSELTALRQSLQRSGARFRGAVHPVALALTMPGLEDPAAELAIDGAMCTPSASSTSPGQPSISPLSLENALASATAAERAEIGSGEPTIVTDYLDRLARAFVAWSAGSSSIKCFANDDPADSRGTRLWWQAGLAGAVLLTALADYAYQRTRWQAVTSEMQVLSQSRTQNRATADQLQSTQNRIKTLEQQLSQTTLLRAQEQALLVARSRQQPPHQRWSVLLDSLAELASDRWWLENWTAHEQSIVLCGLASHSDVVMQLANDLDMRLHEVGWRVATPRITAHKISEHTDGAAGSLVRFEIQLQASGTFAALPAASLSVAWSTEQWRLRR